MSLKPLKRSVSIIGVGCTKFGDADNTPELKGMSLQDLICWAAMDAMEDAGVNPRQIDKLILGQVSAANANSGSIAPCHGLLEFLGMKGKAAVHQSEACATPFDCINEAVLSVASGRYDICMAVDADSARHIAGPDAPSCYLYPSNEYKNLYGRDWAGGVTCQDTAYGRWNGANFGSFDHIGRRYIRDNGITAEELDDALAGQAITSRQHGALNPKAYAQETWEEIAKKRGFEDARAYLKSKYNPKISEYLRPSTFAPLTEGAAAVIVCATEIADQFKQTPIEIVNLAQFDLSVLTPSVTPEMTRGAIQQLYDVTGYKPEDIEYFSTTDGDLTDALESAETCGYLPKGEGWKYFRDGLTRFDSVKPMCTDGGHQCLGHAFGATGMATFGEVVLQMRGQAGPRQIPKKPRVSLLRGWGAGQSETAYIFRTVEGVVPKGASKAYPHYTPQPVVRKFYDALDEGKFLGMKCPECGNVEFPPYPGCNNCGNIDNELVELSGDVTVNELYEVSPAFTVPPYSMYAPLYAGEVKLAEGPGVVALIFGVTHETYAQMRDNGPIKGKLVVCPMGKYNTFAVAVNGASVPKAGDIIMTDEYHKLLTGHLTERD